MRYVLVRLSTQEVLKRNVPQEFVDSVTGLDPDLAYLPMIEQTRPEVDDAFYYLERVEQIVESEYRITWNTVKKPTEELEQIIDNIERMEAQRHISQEDLLKITVLGLTVLFRALDGLQLNAKEQALAQKIVQIGTRIWQNDQYVAQVKAAIRAGQEPDITTGWAAPQ